MTIKFSDITGGGIPYGNNAGRPANPGIGKLYSNGEAQRLELYTAGGWNNIVQEVPGVSSISGNYSEQTNSGVITITGTNFVNGAVATAIGSNGVQVDATSTVYNSLVQLTATFTGLSNQYEPYDIKVTNPSNLFGMIPDALYINASPVWQTSSGSLGSFTEQVSITLSALSATDSDSTITYALASGSALPTGLTLSSSGVISGTLPDISASTTYSFTVNATDGVNTIPRSFSIISTALVPIEYLIVAGGGSGSNTIAGGGGAGGMLTGTYSYNRSGPISISVGQGGAAAATSAVSTRGSNGENSSLFGLVALGGGTAGIYGSNAHVGVSGGSGGGAGGNATGSVNAIAAYGGAGTAGQGHAGGNSAEYGGGGGGGAGGVGGFANKNGTRYDSGGDGGVGLASSITGTTTHYAGGGGGAVRDFGPPARSGVWQIRGEGGIGGGGHGTGYTGDNRAGAAYATSGAPNTGGGGGGGAHSGSDGDQRAGSGGSGVVVIAYPNSFPSLASISGGLTYDTPTRSGYRVYRFTAGTGTITF